MITYLHHAYSRGVIREKLEKQESIEQEHDMEETSNSGSNPDFRRRKSEIVERTADTMMIYDE